MARSRRSGSASVEFAMTAPVLFTLGLGGVEWGWYFNQLMAAQDAIRQGARDGSAQPLDDGGAGCSQCLSVAESRSKAYLQANGLPFQETISTSIETLPDGNLAIAVEANVPYTKAAGGLVPTPDLLRARTVWRIQGQ